MSKGPKKETVVLTHFLQSGGKAKGFLDFSHDRVPYRTK